MRGLTEDIRVAVIGLGYVGLPVAVALGRKYETVGFDINEKRIRELKEGVDRTREMEPEVMSLATGLSFTCDEGGLEDANFYIVTVPTPIEEHKRPDLRPLIAATRTVGAALQKGDVVVYESTVFPGCTEEICVPILEESSGMKYNLDFFCGYSPERINPGDKTHRFSSILKVVSGSNDETAGLVNKVYSSVVGAGTYLAPSIKVAEAAKVIENAQRDLNIAFVNELAIIFEKLGIDTLEVLEAAETKWNFLPFRPGLVGGHCIGVDPYYLTHKAQAAGHHPEIILAGRRINDSMGRLVAARVIKLMIRKKQTIAGSRVLVAGITFKENCPDVRNTRVVDIIDELESFECNVEVFDPVANPEEVMNEYGIDLICDVEKIQQGFYDACVVAVPHEDITGMNIRGAVKSNGIIYDVKGAMGSGQSDGRL